MRLPHVAAFWDNAVAKQPRALACVWRDEALTFAEAEALVARFAGYLRAAGVGPGDRVALVLPNCAPFLLAYWAILRLGAVVVPVNTRLRGEELAFVFSNAEPTVVVVHESFVGGVKEALSRARVTPHLLEVPDAAVEPPAISGAAAVTEVAGIVPHDLAVLLYTSGTTGVPKGAMMRHCDLLFNVQNAILAHSFRHEDVHLLAIPVFAPTAAYSLLPTCAYLQSPVVMAPQPQPAELFRLIAAHRCTTFLGVPMLFTLLVNDPGLEGADLSSLRLIAYSGAPMPARTITRLRERFPSVSLHNFFGLSETISITHVLPNADAVRRADSIGKLLPEVYARIVDEQDKPLGPGEIGELCFGRGNVISGYWRQEGRLEAAIRDGWFHTGDLAWQDEAGYFYVQGRKSEMIIVAGHNVYEHEVEKAVLRHPGVREVAVIGVPATGARAALGELVKAVVVCQPGVELTALEIKGHCAALLPSHKVPQEVEFRPELPRTATGKVRKQDLRRESCP